jgi:hypothetical protein
MCHLFLGKRSWYVLLVTGGIYLDLLMPVDLYLDHLVTREHVQRFLSSMCARLALAPSDTTLILSKFRRTDGHMLAKLSEVDVKERLVDAEVTAIFIHSFDAPC